ncbi:MAG: hypothetical protein ABJZ98_10835 [Saccharospirillum sp.]|uniref:hypothetical protein n=1 Tax=Saccharospirillum sp. TaxID=2033801 RepID=UPI0032978308
MPPDRDALWVLMGNIYKACNDGMMITAAGHGKTSFFAVTPVEAIAIKAIVLATFRYIKRRLVDVLILKKR